MESCGDAGIPGQPEVLDLRVSNRDISGMTLFKCKQRVLGICLSQTSLSLSTAFACHPLCGRAVLPSAQYSAGVPVSRAIYLWLAFADSWAQYLSWCAITPSEDSHCVLLGEPPLHRTWASFSVGMLVRRLSSVSLGLSRVRQDKISGDNGPSMPPASRYTGTLADFASCGNKEGCRGAGP